MNNEFILYDRKEVIKNTIEKYGEENFYISFSGGKDSTVLSKIIDEAIPDNKIPRVFFNTGIEYNMIVDYVKKLAKNDKRIIIYNAGVNIKEMLESNGYPFKSKLFSKKVFTFDRSGSTKTVNYYVNGIKEDGTPSQFKCPKSLKYIFTDERKKRLKISHKCCDKLKKDTAKKYEKETGKFISIVGVRQAEGGIRKYRTGCAQFKNDKLVNFKPLNPVSNEFIDWYIAQKNIQLCDLYYQPYNFERTGCKGCPFAINLKAELDVMQEYLPAERRQVEAIWKPVYDEYRKIGYRGMKNL